MSLTEALGPEKSTLCNRAWSHILCYFLYDPKCPFITYRICLIIPSGVLVSLRPSVRPSVCPSRVRCPLCIAYSSDWIFFIFKHLIKQLQKCVACNVSFKISQFEFLAIFQNLELWLCLVLTWDLMWITGTIRVIMGWRGISQNAGVLVVLVFRLPAMFHRSAQLPDATDENITPHPTLQLLRGIVWRLH